MFKSIADSLRSVIATMSTPEGDVVQKVWPEPKIKPPRRETPTSNKTNRTDFSKNYMRDYRQNGKDYQKMAPGIKKLRREQRKRQKEKIKAQNPLKAHLLNQEISWWQKNGVDHEDFDFICNRRGFNDEERNILIEDLCDLNLITF
jgi:hypothetical protein